MMPVATLAMFDLRRLARKRPLMAAMMVPPLVVGIARALLPEAHWTLISAWCCPVVCAALTAGVVGIQRLVDRATGLSEAIRSCPVSSRAISASGAVAWAVVFGLQMGVLGAILALRF